MSASNDFNNSTSGTITIRFSDKSDTDKLLRFYGANPHRHVDNRGADLIAERAAAGRVLIVETDNGEIGAASIAYDFRKAARGRDATWIEIGSTRSVLKGMGLYPFIVSAQTINEFLQNAPADKFIAAVYKDNQPVTDMLTKQVGWRFFTPPADLAKIADLEKDLQKIHCFESSSPCLPQQARTVISFLADAAANGLTNKKTGETFTVDFSRLSLAGTLKSLVHELAQGEYGKFLETAAPIPLTKARLGLDNSLNIGKGPYRRP